MNQTDDQARRCRQCGAPIETQENGNLRCSDPDCPTNKKTKPLCKKCRVIMNETRTDDGRVVYRCPVCQVVLPS